MCRRAKILVGGKPVDKYTLRNLRDASRRRAAEKCAVLGHDKGKPQMGRRERSDEEIAEACRIAQADAFIRTFPTATIPTWGRAA